MTFKNIKGTNRQLNCTACGRRFSAVANSKRTVCVPCWDKGKR